MIDIKKIKVKAEDVKEMSLAKLMNRNPKLAEELHQAIAKEAYQLKMVISKQLHSEFPAMAEAMLLGGDNHYNLYESLRSPVAQDLDPQYVFRKKGKDLTEGESAELCRLKNLQESSDTDALSVKAGIPLKKRQSESELRTLQLIVNSRYNVDPILRNIVDNITRYILGNGARFVIPNDKVTDSIERFVGEINFNILAKDFVKTAMKDGESGIELESKIVGKRSKDGGIVEWLSYKVFSEEIKGFDFLTENPGFKLGYYKTPVNYDIKSIKQLRNEWIADVRYYFLVSEDGKSKFKVRDFKSPNHKEFTPDKVLLWYIMGDKRELRGRIPVEAILRDLRLYEDFRISRAVLNYERSKVLYLKRVKQALRRTTTDLDISRKSAAPKGGVQLTIGPNEDYQMMTADLNATDADKDGLQFLYAISSGVTTPIYITGMRSDVQNYSAIKNTDSPFNQMILEYAMELSVCFKDMAKWAIYRYIEAGILDKTVKIQRVAKEKTEFWLANMEKAVAILERLEGAKKVSKKTKNDVDDILNNLNTSVDMVSIPTIEIPIDFIIAEAVKPNPLEMAKVAFIERKLGIVSSQTLSEIRGYNWPQEVIRQLFEIKLGIYSPSKTGGQSNSSGANAGMGEGGDIDDGSGTMNQNAK